jgi:hypothetical protein
MLAGGGEIEDETSTTPK